MIIVFKKIQTELIRIVITLMINTLITILFIVLLMTIELLPIIIMIILMIILKHYNVVPVKKNDNTKVNNNDTNHTNNIHKHSKYYQPYQQPKTLTLQNFNILPNQKNQSTQSFPNMVDRELDQRNIHLIGHRGQVNHENVGNQFPWI